MYLYNLELINLYILEADIVMYINSLYRLIQFQIFFHIEYADTLLIPI